MIYSMSTTQANNIAIFAGLISIVLSKLNVNILPGDLEAFIGLGVSFVGTVLQYIHRYKKGDVTLGGSFKTK